MTKDDKKSKVDSVDDLESAADFFDSTDLDDMQPTEVDVVPSRAPMVSRSIRMEQSVMNSIRAVAKRRGVPVTQLMRQWVEEGLVRDRDDRTHVAPRDATYVSFSNSRSPRNLASDLETMRHLQVVSNRTSRTAQVEAQLKRHAQGDVRQQVAGEPSHYGPTQKRSA